MSKKIAMIGAGSIVFCKTLMSDIMATPVLADSEFALMSRTEPRLRRMEAFGKKMLKENGLPGAEWRRSESTTRSRSNTALTSA
jgi:alpha-galactosidase